MAIAVAIIILLVALAIAYQLSESKSKKRKYIVWGITTMLAIAPLFSWLISITYASVEGSGWAGVALISIMFPIIFLVGLVILLVGIFRKKDPKTIEK
ncbi:hypothetical protein [Halalkalibacter urbisdiaboli]|uniref:hypothetical protein n=1 Tax=Halalkalibacter urbisdiaboli TaxID=1960589 RepID=UPI000B45117E|nr:hypothetical protein [Halalkalibacter urbisdiaboli]